MLAFAASNVASLDDMSMKPEDLTPNREDDNSKSVTARALCVLEAVAESPRPLTLSELTEVLSLPKATVLRIVRMLEAEDCLQRSLGGRRFVPGPRLARLAVNVSLRSVQRGPCHAILSALVEETGETCNVTMLDGNNLVYVDRVESGWPLQVRLQPGSRVPLHCTASGKLFLSLLPAEKRRQLLYAAPLKRYTGNTLTDPEVLEEHLHLIRETKVGTDNEEFMEGLVAVAVPVIDGNKRMCATIAVHGPVGRISLGRAMQHVPALRRAADALAEAYLDAGH